MVYNFCNSVKLTKNIFFVNFHLPKFVSGWDGVFWLRGRVLSLHRAPSRNRLQGDRHPILRQFGCAICLKEIIVQLLCFKSQQEIQFIVNSLQGSYTGVHAFLRISKNI